MIIGYLANMRSFLFVFLITFIAVGCGTSRNRAEHLTGWTLIAMGEDSVKIAESFNDTLSKIIYLNLHEDEQTSIKAIQKYARKQAINYFYLHHTGARRITFHVRGREYSVDPNRIYTDTGRRRTMDDGGHFSPLGNIIVTDLADEITSILASKNWVITLHNNTPDNYSILSYLPGAEEAKNTKHVNVNPKMDPDDFVYTTDEALYLKLKENEVNVILQDNTGFVDDGSLSVFCGMTSKPYANIETEHGHLKEQIKLLKLVSKLVVD